MARRIGLAALPMLALATAWLRADVQVMPIFGDHMVLQQDAPLPVWGTANPGENVTVTVGPDNATTSAGADGKWRVNLAPLPGSSTPLTMTIAGKNTLTFQDVLVGEVWVAGGQSNMQFRLKNELNGATEIPQANDSQLRFFVSVGPPGLEPADHLVPSSKWVLTTPADIPDVSAVAYFFAKQLRAKLNRPVAIVQAALQGTPAEVWIPADAIKKDPALKSYSDKLDAAVAAYPQAQAGYPAKLAAWKQDMAQWNKDVGVTYNPILQAWQAEADKARAAGQTPPPMPQPSRPKPPQPPSPWGNYGTPTVLYNADVAPIVPYAIRGAIWYQGEANANTWSTYTALLSALIGGWREHWGEGDFPFLIVQLPRWKQGAGWPPLREAQAKAAALPNTALATAIDLGDPNNLHPVDKLDVAKRLALVARHEAYGEKDLVWTGPIYDSMKIEGNSIRVSFTQTGSGLAIGSAPWVPPNSAPIPTTSLLGFAIADARMHWYAAVAKIDGNTVVVSSDQVPAPVAVRYAWQNSPECNLYNQEGLPAAPFRTDDWRDVGEAPSPAPTNTAAPAPPRASTLPSSSNNALSTSPPSPASSSSAPMPSAPANTTTSDQPVELNGPPYTKLTNLIYTRPEPGKACALDLDLPTTGTGPFPVIVGIHGGGWGAARSVWFKPGLYPWRFLTGNYAFANVDYRTVPSTFPAALVDCKSAIRWLRANAAKYNLDPNRIGVWGPSAGGHLVAMLGTTGDLKKFDVGDNLDFSSRVQAVCDFCGPTDLLDASQRPDHDKWKALIDVETRFLGGAPLDVPDKARAASSLTYVSPNDPPFLIVHGDSDTTVPPEQSQKLYDALVKNGVPAKIYFYPKGGHGGWGEKPEVIAMVQAFFDQYLMNAKPAANASGTAHP